MSECVPPSGSRQAAPTAAPVAQAVNSSTSSNATIVSAASSSSSQPQSPIAAMPFAAVNGAPITFMGSNGPIQINSKPISATEYLAEQKLKAQLASAFGPKIMSATEYLAAQKAKAMQAQTGGGTGAATSAPMSAAEYLAAHKSKSPQDDKPPKSPTTSPDLAKLLGVDPGLPASELCYLAIRATLPPTTMASVAPCAGCGAEAAGRWECLECKVDAAAKTTGSDKEIAQHFCYACTFLSHPSSGHTLRWVELPSESPNEVQIAPMDLYAGYLIRQYQGAVNELHSGRALNGQHTLHALLCALVKNATPALLKNIKQTPHILHNVDGHTLQALNTPSTKSCSKCASRIRDFECNKCMFGLCKVCFVSSESPNLFVVGGAFALMCLFQLARSELMLDRFEAAIILTYQSLQLGHALWKQDQAVEEPEFDLWSPLTTVAWLSLRQNLLLLLAKAQALAFRTDDALITLKQLSTTNACALRMATSVRLHKFDEAFRRRAVDYSNPGVFRLSSVPSFSVIVRQEPAFKFLWQKNTPACNQLIDSYSTTVRNAHQQTSTQQPSISNDSKSSTSPVNTSPSGYDEFPDGRQQSSANSGYDTFPPATSTYDTLPQLQMRDKRELISNRYDDYDVSSTASSSSTALSASGYDELSTQTSSEAELGYDTLGELPDKSDNSDFGYVPTRSRSMAVSIGQTPAHIEPPTKATPSITLSLPEAMVKKLAARSLRDREVADRQNSQQNADPAADKMQLIVDSDVLLRMVQGFQSGFVDIEARLACLINHLVLAHPRFAMLLATDAAEVFAMAWKVDSKDEIQSGVESSLGGGRGENIMPNLTQAQLAQEFIHLCGCYASLRDEDGNLYESETGNSLGLLPLSFSTRRDWNRELATMWLQRITQQSELLTANMKLLELYQSFQSFSSSVAEWIVLELGATSNLSRRIPALATQAGVAGGRKYVFGNIFFKFSKDAATSRGMLYGGDHLAAKAASSEFHASTEVLRFACEDEQHEDGQSSGPHQGTPSPTFSALIKTRGHTILAQAFLPSTPATLIYGSGDAGKTVFDAKEEQHAGFRGFIDRFADELHLASHQVKSDLHGITVPLRLAGDVEGHCVTGLNTSNPSERGYLLLDLSRLFPPHSRRDGRGKDNWSRLFRPEFLRGFRPVNGGRSQWTNSPYFQQHSDVQLCSDAFSVWGGHDQRIHMFGNLAKQADVFLLQTVIPTLAASLTDGTRPGNLRAETATFLHEHWYLKSGREERIKKPRATPEEPNYQPPDLTLQVQHDSPVADLFHSSGLNLFYLAELWGSLESKATDPIIADLRLFLAQEIVIRCMKQIIRRDLTESSRLNECDIVLRVFAMVFDGLGSSSTQTDIVQAPETALPSGRGDEWWMNQLPALIIDKYSVSGVKTSDKAARALASREYLNIVRTSFSAIERVSKGDVDKFASNWTQLFYRALHACGLHFAEYIQPAMLSDSTRMFKTILQVWADAAKSVAAGEVWYFQLITFGRKVLQPSHLPIMRAFTARFRKASPSIQQQAILVSPWAASSGGDSNSDRHNEELHDCIKNGDAKGVESILTKHGDTLLSLYFRGQFTPLLGACFFGNFKVLQAVLSHTAAASTINMCATHNNYSPLMLLLGSAKGKIRTAATEAELMAGVLLLLRSGASITHVSSLDGFCPLTVACIAAPFSVIALLYYSGASTQINHAAKRGSFTPLHELVALANSNDNMEIRDRYAAMRWLLHAGANPNALDGNNKTIQQYPAMAKEKMMAEAGGPEIGFVLSQRLGQLAQTAGTSFPLMTHLRILFDFLHHYDGGARLSQLRNLPWTTDAGFKHNGLNYLFLGGPMSVMSERFTTFLPGLKFRDTRLCDPQQSATDSNNTFCGGSIIEAKWKSWRFVGRLMRRKSIWGEEQVLCSPVPVNFQELLKSELRLHVDAAIIPKFETTSSSASLSEAVAAVSVSSSTAPSPSSSRLHSGAVVATFSLGDPVVELPCITWPRLQLRELSESEWQDWVRDSCIQDGTVTQCEHPKEKVKMLPPDPRDEEFLERCFKLCVACGHVVSRMGICARQACNCKGSNNAHSLESAFITSDFKESQDMY